MKPKDILAASLAAAAAATTSCQAITDLTGYTEQVEKHEDCPVAKAGYKLDRKTQKIFRNHCYYIPE